MDLLLLILVILVSIFALGVIFDRKKRLVRYLNVLQLIIMSLLLIQVIRNHYLHKGLMMDVCRQCSELAVKEVCIKKACPQ